MKKGLKYILLILGLLLVILSFLFWGRQFTTYRIFLITGLIIAAISYLWILLSKTSQKIKIIWTVICVFAVGFQRLSEGFIINASYRIYVSQHYSTLTETNNILSSLPEGIMVAKDSIKDESNVLSTSDIEKLRENIDKLKITHISKGKKVVYYNNKLDKNHTLRLMFYPKEHKCDMHCITKRVVGSWHFGMMYTYTD